jgi:hypothetical protein
VQAFQLFLFDSLTKDFEDGRYPFDKIASRTRRQNGQSSRLEIRRQEPSVKAKNLLS